MSLDGGSARGEEAPRSGDTLGVGRAGNRERWSPTQFIERRTFCPLSEIQEILDHYRHRSGASEVLLLSIDRFVSLRTLTLVSHERDPLARQLVRLLQDDPGTAPRRRLRQNPAWLPVDSSNVGSLLENLAAQARSFPSLGPEFYEVLLRMHREAAWHVVQPFEPDERATANGLLLRRRGHSTERDAEVVGEVMQRINATANAAVHRDSRVMVSVDRTLRRIASQETSRGPLRELLEMAKSVSSSTAAAILLLDRGNASPRLVLAEMAPDQRGLGVGGATLRSEQFSYADDAGSPSVLAVAAYQRGRPLLRQPGSSWPGQYGATWVHHGYPDPNEIAVPIPRAAGGGATPNAGVLVLCRAGEDAVQYGDYDLAILRNVALRIALLRAALVVEEASVGVIRATRAVSHAEPPVVPEIPAPPDTRLRHRTATVQPLTDRLPVDLARTVLLAEPIVEFAARVTGSLSATLRFLVVTPQRDGRYVLRRVIAWPAWRLNEEHEDVSIDDSSTHAWVARAGRLAYIPNAFDEASFRDYPGLTEILRISGRPTRSELCVPIHVDGRLIGTLNLESATPGNYALLTNLVAACASQIALATASIRREYLRDVLSIGSDVQNSAHELVGLLGSLESGRDDNPRNNAVLEHVHSVVHTVLGTLQPMGPTIGQLKETPTTLLGVIREASKIAKVEVNLIRPRDLPVEWSERYSRRFYLAMYEILRNASDYGRLDESGVPTVAVQTTVIGGHKYYDVTITHMYRHNHEPDPHVLYRAPVQREDRLHFGAYTAGAIIRSMGGDIVPIRDDRKARLTLLLSIPSEERSDPTERRRSQ